jgi:hypothetical protein
MRNAAPQAWRAHAQSMEQNRPRAVAYGRRVKSLGGLHAAIS